MTSIDFIVKDARDKRRLKLRADREGFDAGKAMTDIVEHELITQAIGVAMKSYLPRSKYFRSTLFDLDQSCTVDGL